MGARICLFPLAVFIIQLSMPVASAADDSSDVSSGVAQSSPSPSARETSTQKAVQYNASATVLANGTILLNFTSANVTFHSLDKSDASGAKKQSLKHISLLRKTVIDIGGLFLFLITMGVCIGLVGACREYQLAHRSPSARWRELCLKQSTSGISGMATPSASLPNQWHAGSKLVHLR